MHRTNIYLTGVEQAGLDARAAAEGSTRSDLVRSIVDRELNLTEDSDLDEIFVELASELADRSRALASDDPDLRVD